MTIHSHSAIAKKIETEVGSFVFVSSSPFEAHGEMRTRYTVRKPKGKKLIHLIGYGNGVIRKV